MLAALYAMVFRRRLEPVGPAGGPSAPAAALRYALNGLVPPALVALAGLHSFVASGIGALLALGLSLWARPDLARVAAGLRVVRPAVQRAAPVAVPSLTEG